MSTKYRNSRDVPLDIIITRLKELSDAVTGGRESQGREFTMRIPAECDRDADLVIAEAAVRLASLQDENEAQRQANFTKGDLAIEWKVKLEKAKARVAELEIAALNAVQLMSGGQAKADLRDAYDAEESAEAWLLRKQAEAVEKSALLFPGRELTDIRCSLHTEAQRLRDQAKTLEGSHE